MKNEYCVVITTTEKKADAEKIADALLDKKLAACIQIVGPITSRYVWKGKIETSEEWLCLIKANQSAYGDLEAAVKEVHSYDVPEIIALPVIAGSKSYLDWIDQSTR